MWSILKAAKLSSCLKNRFSHMVQFSRLSNLLKSIMDDHQHIEIPTYRGRNVIWTVIYKSLTAVKSETMKSVIGFAKGLAC